MKRLATPPNPPSHPEPEDADCQFLLSLCPRLRALDPQKKSLVQMEILKVLHNAEFGE